MAVTNVTTYTGVTNGGAENPFDYSYALITQYGFTAVDLHNYMQVNHARTPVFDDLLALESRIYFVFIENKTRWDAIYKAQQELETMNPNSGFTETEHIAHTGTDNSTNGNTVTDSKNTYDNATLRQIGQSTSNGTGGITYGHVIDTEKTHYDGSPLDSIDKYMSVNNFSLFRDIIDKVLTAISCRVYIPQKPITTSNN